LGYYVIYWGIYSQMSTTMFNQGCQMNLRIGNNVIMPVAALNLFDTLVIIVLIPLFDKCLYPTLHRWGLRLTMLRKIGIGFFFAALSMLAAGVIEVMRLERFRAGRVAGDSICHSSSENLMVDMSIFWQVPQFVLIGTSEVLASVTALEFFYTQAPDSMKSVCAALNLLTTAIGTWLVALLIPIVNSNSSQKWISDDANHGHLDYFFFLLAGLMLINILFYIHSSLSYLYVVKEDVVPLSDAEILGGSEESVSHHSKDGELRELTVFLPRTSDESRNGTSKPE